MAIWSAGGGRAYALIISVLKSTRPPIYSKGARSHDHLDSDDPLLRFDFLCADARCSQHRLGGPHPERVVTHSNTWTSALCADLHAGQRGLNVQLRPTLIWRRPRSPPSTATTCSSSLIARRAFLSPICCVPLSGHDSQAPTAPTKPYGQRDCRLRQTHLERRNRNMGVVPLQRVSLSTVPGVHAECGKPRWTSQRPLITQIQFRW